MTTKKEEFKAVEFMRKQREELSLLHADNPGLYEKQMEAIREKYGQRSTEKKKRGIISTTRNQGSKA
ncbi:MAG: hypothetical protein WBB31_09735 [Saprospiraceae bacterium]